MEAFLKKLGLQDAKEKIALSKGVDLTRVNLNAEEGFLLSRIDGAGSLEELLQLSSFPREKTLAILEKFINLRLIGSTANIESEGSATSVAPEFAEVSDLYQKLRGQKIDLRTLLGVSKHATSKDLRKAFLDFSKKFHPDRLSRFNAPPEVLKWSEFIISRLNQEMQKPDGAEKASHDPRIKRSLLQFAQKNENLSKGKTLLREAKKGMLSDPGRALDSLKIVLSFDPENQEAKALIPELESQVNEKKSTDLFKHGKALEEALAYDEAGRVYEEAAAGAPRNSLIQRTCGEFFLRRMGDPKRALGYFEQAVAAEPKNIENYRLLETTLRSLKREDEAKEVLLALQKLDKRGVSALDEKKK